MLEISVPILPNSRKTSSLKAILEQHMSMFILDSTWVTLIQQRDKDKTKPPRCGHLIASKHEISAHVLWLDAGKQRHPHSTMPKLPAWLWVKWAHSCLKLTSTYFSPYSTQVLKIALRQLQAVCRSSPIHMQTLVSKTLLKGMEVPHISQTLIYWLNIPQRQKTKAVSSLLQNAETIPNKQHCGRDSGKWCRPTSLL